MTVNANIYISIALLVRGIAYLALTGMFLTAIWRNHLAGVRMRVLVVTMFFYFLAESSLIIARIIDRFAHILCGEVSGLPDSNLDLVSQIVVAVCSVIMVGAFHAVYDLAKKEEEE